MKKIDLFVMIVLITSLAACVPQVTVTPEPTVTPPPTATIIPTPTFHPEFMALQELISSSSGRFTLNPNGTVEDGGQAIPGLKVDAKGVMTLTVDGEEVTLDPAQAQFDDEAGFSYPGYVLNEDGAWVEVIKEFPWCKDTSKFLEYPVKMDELQMQANFVRSTLKEEMLDPSKFNNIPVEFEYKGYKLPGWDLVDSYLIPNPFLKPPHFAREGSAPFLKDMMCGVTEIDGETYFVAQVAYYVEGVPATEWPVMTAVYKFQTDKLENWLKVAGWYADEMNLVPWNVEDTAIATRFVNPATGANFTAQEVEAIIEEMKQGNFAHTHGLVLNTKLVKGNWYK